MHNLVIEPEDQMNCKVRRIKALIKSQFQLYTNDFEKIFQHIHESHQFYSGNQNYIYKIHPKWIDSENNLQDADRIIEQVTQLDYLNIEIIISDQHNVIEFEQMSSELYQNELNLYDNFQNYIKLNYHFWSNKVAYTRWL